MAFSMKIKVSRTSSSLPFGSFGMALIFEILTDLNKIWRKGAKNNFELNGMQSKSNLPLFTNQQEGCRGYLEHFASQFRQRVKTQIRGRDIMQNIREYRLKLCSRPITCANNIGNVCPWRCGWPHSVLQS